MRGTRLSPEGWNRIFKDHREALLLTIPVVAGEVLQSMLAGAGRAYRYFKADRLAQGWASGPARSSGPEPYERESPKVGRNDPCPCGSGKKYKRCFGRGDSEDGALH